MLSTAVEHVDLAGGERDRVGVLGGLGLGERGGERAAARGRRAGAVDHGVRAVGDFEATFVETRVSLAVRGTGKLSKRTPD